MAGLVAAGYLLLAVPGGARAMLGHGSDVGHGSFVLAGTLLCAVGLPRQVVAFAGGFAFGTIEGGALALAAQILSCTIDVLWARVVGRQWAWRFLKRGADRPGLVGRIARLDGFLAANPFSATLMLRLLPVGNNLALSLLAGVSGVALLPFVAASGLGYIPQTLVFALLGSGTRVDQAAQLALAAALLVISAAIGMILLRRMRASNVV